MSRRVGCRDEERRVRQAAFIRDWNARTADGTPEFPSSVLREKHGTRDPAKWASNLRIAGYAVASRATGSR